MKKTSRELRRLSGCIDEHVTQINGYNLQLNDNKIKRMMSQSIWSRDQYVHNLTEKTSCLLNMCNGAIGENKMIEL